MNRRVCDLLEMAVESLRGHVETPSIDAQVLLAHTLDRDRGWLFTWPEHEPGRPAIQRFTALVARRCAGEPVAYLTGRRAFWSLDLQVTTVTLIPRPETEHLVETVLELPLPPQASILDLGTGSGALALALARERPAWSVVATDACAAALDVAQANAVANAIEGVTFRHGDWFDALATGQRFSLIVSNPPYVAADDPHLSSGDLRFEPREALVAGHDGMTAIRHLVATAPRFLEAGGWLWLEHGADQGAAVRTVFSRHGFGEVQTRRDLAGLERCSGGRLGAT